MDKNQAILDLIAEVLKSDLGTAGLLESVVCKLAATFPAQLCSMLMLDDGHAELIFQSHTTASPQRIYKLDLDVETALSACLSSQEPVLLNDLLQDERLSQLNQATGVSIQSLLCLPVISGASRLGALILANPHPDSFQPEDLEMLKPLVSVLAHRLHTVQTIHSLQVANAELEVIRWQLTNSRNILRALFDSIPTSIYIIDRKFNLAAVNMHRARRTGLPPNQLVGRRCFQALFQLDDPCPDCRVLDTLFGGESTTRTRRHWETDFDPQEWEIFTYPICDDNEQVTQAILLEQDVTEKRRLEATLAQSEKLAAVGQLAAGLAHEINNPLTAIIANAQLLQRELPPDDDKQELVDLIARAGARANQVVRNLLDLARKEHYDFTPLDVNENIRKALTFMQHEFTNRSIELSFEPGADLPKVIASQDHLQGVWLNLLSNAIDALEEGRRLIRVATHHSSNEVQVIITDTGKGIAPQNLLHIFEPFYTTKGPGFGTGLGLSVCHRVIKQHGGSILVESQLGVGTQFTVVLPIT
jgi:two-component system NtrC family sensor kinase